MAGNIKVEGRKTREASIEAVITRKDGTVERLGTISYYHRNPLKRLAWKLKRLFGVRT